MQWSFGASSYHIYTLFAFLTLRPLGKRYMGWRWKRKGGQRAVEAMIKRPTCNPEASHICQKVLGPHIPRRANSTVESLRDKFWALLLKDRIARKYVA